MAPATAFARASLGRSARIQAARSSTRGRISSRRRLRRTSAVSPLISRSALKMRSIRRTASMAKGAFDALATSASSKNLRRACHPTGRLLDRRGRAALGIEGVEAGEGIGLQDPRPFGQMLAGMGTAPVAGVEEERCRRVHPAEGFRHALSDQWRSHGSHHAHRSINGPSRSSSWPAPAPWCRRRAAVPRPAHGSGWRHARGEA